MITLNLTAEQVDALVQAAKDAEASMHLTVCAADMTLPFYSIRRRMDDLRRRRSILIDAIAAVSNQRRRKAPGGGK